MSLLQLAAETIVGAETSRDFTFDPPLQPVADTIRIFYDNVSFVVLMM